MHGLQVTHPLGSPLPVLGNAVVVCSIVVGITTTAILFCSHFHQIDGDRAAGKLSPLVRLGTKRALSVRCACVFRPAPRLCARVGVLDSPSFIQWNQ